MPISWIWRCLYRKPGFHLILITVISKICPDNLWETGGVCFVLSDQKYAKVSLSFSASQNPRPALESRKVGGGK